MFKLIRRMNCLKKNQIPNTIFTRIDYNSDLEKYIIIKEESLSLFSNKRILLFGIPGAFTPVSTFVQIPEYEKNYSKFIERGIDDVYCISVNDPYVMFNFKEGQNIKNITMIPDGNGEFTNGINQLVTNRNLGFNIRSWRYSAIITDCLVEKMFEEDDKMNESYDILYDNTKAEKILDYISYK